MNSILDAIKKLSDLEAKIASLEEELKEASKEKERLSTKVIPDLMMEFSLTGIELLDGRKVEIQPVISGRLTNESAEWLIQNGHEGLLKRELHLPYSPEALERVRAAGLEPEVDCNIHHQTLNAFLREQVKAGTPLPAKAFSLYQGMKTNIKPKKN